MLEFKIIRNRKTFLIFSTMVLIFYYSCQRTSTEPQNSYNKPPIISSLLATLDSVKLGEKTIIRCTAYDPNLDSLYYSWDVVSVLFNQIDSSYIFEWDGDAGEIINLGHEAIWKAPMTEGMFQISCKVFDNAGNDDISTLQIKVVSSGCLFVKTDKTSYFRDDLFECKIINKTDSTAYFFYCGGRVFPYATVDKKNNGDWKSYGGIVCDCFNPMYLDGLLPGGVLIDTIEVSMSIGTYRMNIPYSWKDEYPLSDSLFSNSFSVK